MAFERGPAGYESSRAGPRTPTSASAPHADRTAWEAPSPLSFPLRTTKHTKYTKRTRCFLFRVFRVFRGLFLFILEQLVIKTVDQGQPTCFDDILADAYRA